MFQRILIVDDDIQLTSFLARFLKKHEIDAVAVASAHEAREELKDNLHSLIVLDLNLPDADGLDIAKEVRQTCRTPIVMLTARDEVYDKILGLEMGADDYLTKPFEPRELLARIKAVLRRTQDNLDQQNEAAQERNIHFSGFELDLTKRQLSKQESGEIISLTATEISLLQLLAENAGEVTSRHKIMDKLYGNNINVTDRAIDAHVARLRRKIDNDGDGMSLIRSAHGEGYLLAAQIENA